MKHTRTHFRIERCRVCGRRLDHESCYKGKKRKYVCEECYEAMHINSPDDTFLEVDIVKPDGRRITVRELV